LSEDSRHYREFQELPRVARSTVARSPVLKASSRFWAWPRSRPRVLRSIPPHRRWGSFQPFGYSAIEGTITKSRGRATW